MNRINQQLGQVKWYSDHLQQLQSEPIKAIDNLFAYFPSCVLSGCQVVTTTIKPGLISFVWTDTGVEKTMVVPFDGASGVVFPKYFILEKTNVMRVYENGGSKVFSESYKAVLSDTVPANTPSIQIQSSGATVRLLDAFQSALYRFVTDTEKNTWNAKLAASAYTAADVLAKLLTVDGVGTGLDADLLDGQHITYFATRLPRVSSTASAASVTPNVDNYDAIDITAQAVALAIVNPIGTPGNKQKLLIDILDNGTIRAISWGTAYAAGGTALPTATIATKQMSLVFIYDTTAAKWLLRSNAQTT